MLIFKTIITISIYILWFGLCEYYVYKETGIITALVIAKLMIIIMALSYQVGKIKK